MADDKTYKTYRVDGQTVDIPTENIDAFLKDYPAAKEYKSFIVDKDTVDIPIENTQDFLKDYPKAKETYPTLKKKGDTGFFKDYTKNIPSDVSGGTSSLQEKIAKKDYGSITDDEIDKLPVNDYEKQAYKLMRDNVVAQKQQVNFATPQQPKSDVDKLPLITLKEEKKDDTELPTGQEKILQGKNKPLPSESKNDKINLSLAMYKNNNKFGAAQLAQSIAKDDKYYADWANRMSAKAEIDRKDYQAAINFYAAIPDDNKTPDDLQNEVFLHNQVKDYGAAIDKAHQIKEQPLTVDNINAKIYAEQAIGHIAYQSGDKATMDKSIQSMDALQNRKDQIDKGTIFDIYAQPKFNKEDWQKAYSALKDNFLTAPLMGAAEGIGKALQGLYDLYQQDMRYKIPKGQPVLTGDEYRNLVMKEKTAAFADVVSGTMSAAFNMNPAIYAFNVGTGALGTAEKAATGSDFSLVDKAQEIVFSPATTVFSMFDNYNSAVDKKKTPLEQESDAAYNRIKNDLLEMMNVVVAVGGIHAAGKAYKAAKGFYDKGDKTGGDKVLQTEIDKSAENIKDKATAFEKVSNGEKVTEADAKNLKDLAVESKDALKQSSDIIQEQTDKAVTAQTSIPAPEQKTTGDKVSPTEKTETQVTDEDTEKKIAALNKGDSYTDDKTGITYTKNEDNSITETPKTETGIKEGEQIHKIGDNISYNRTFGVSNEKSEITKGKINQIATNDKGETIYGIKYKDKKGNEKQGWASGQDIIKYSKPESTITPQPDVKTDVGSDNYKRGDNQLTGRSKKKTIPNGEQIDGTYKIVSSDDIIASHNEETFSQSDNFPKNEKGKTVNDRDYQNDKNAQAEVVKMAQSLDDRAISQTPIVSKDGIVLDGNNRTMSRKLAAKRGTDTKYIEQLKEQADLYGIAPGQIDNIKNPMLVFEAKDDMPYNTKTFSKFNLSEKKEKSPIEKAVEISKVMTDRGRRVLFNIFKGSEGNISDITSKPNKIKEIVKFFEDEGLLQTNEMPRYFDRERLTATPEGVALIKNTLLGSAVDEDTIRTLDADQMGDIKNKILASVVDLVKNSSLGENSLKDNVIRGIDIINRAKKAGLTLEQWANQLDMFDQLPYDATDLAMAIKLQGKFTDFVRKYNSDVGKTEVDFETGQPTIRSRESIISDILKQELNDYEKTKKNIEALRQERERAISKPVADIKQEGEGVNKQQQSAEVDQQPTPDTKESQVNNTENLTDDTIIEQKPTNTTELNKPYVEEKKTTELDKFQKASKKARETMLKLAQLDKAKSLRDEQGKQTQAMGGTLEDIINKTFDIIDKTYEKAKDVAAAVKSGIDYLKELFDKGDIDEKKYNELKDEINKQYGTGERKEKPIKETIAENTGMKNKLSAAYKKLKRQLELEQTPEKLSKETQEQIADLSQGEKNALLEAQKAREELKTLEQKKNEQLAKAQQEYDALSGKLKTDKAKAKYEKRKADIESAFREDALKFKEQILLAYKNRLSELIKANSEGIRTLTGAKVENLVKKINDVKTTNQLKNVIKYVEKVTTDADYSKKLSEANKIRADILRIAKKFNNATNDIRTFFSSMSDLKFSDVMSSGELQQFIDTFKPYAEQKNTLSTSDLIKEVGKFQDMVEERLKQKMRENNPEYFKDGTINEDMSYKDMLRAIRDKKAAEQEETATGEKQSKKGLRQQEIVKDIKAAQNILPDETGDSKNNERLAKLKAIDSSKLPLQQQQQMKLVLDEINNNGNYSEVQDFLLQTKEGFGFNPLEDDIPKDASPTFLKNTLKTIGKGLGYINVFKYLDKGLQQLLRTKRILGAEKGADIYTTFEGEKQKELQVLNQQHIEGLNKTFEQLEKALNTRFSQDEMRDLNIAFGDPVTEEGAKLQKEAAQRVNKKLADLGINENVRKQISDYIYNRINELGVNIEHMKDYIYGNYEGNDAMKDLFVNKVLATQKWKNRKAFPTYADAYAHGLRLKDENPITNLKQELASAISTISAKNLVEDHILKDNKDIMVGEQERNSNPNKYKDWKQINITGSGIFNKLWFHPEYADAVNKIIARNPFNAKDANNFVKSLNWFRHTTQMVKLYGSFFHPLNMVTTSMFSNIEGVKSLINSINRGDWKTQEHTLDAVRNGMSLHGAAENETIDFLSKQFSRLVNSAVFGNEKLNAVGRVLKQIPLTPQNMKVIFNEWIPYLKSEAYRVERQKLADRLKVDVDQLTDGQKQKLVESVQNRFGEMNEKLLGRSGVVSSVARMIFNAPGYGEGNFRVLERGGEELYHIVKGAVTFNKAELKDTWQQTGLRNAQFMVKSLVGKAVIATGVSWLVFGQKPPTPKDNEDILDYIKDRCKIWTGDKDSNGDDVAIDLLTYEKDWLSVGGNMADLKPMKAVSEFAKRVGNAESTLAQISTDVMVMVSGKQVTDYKGKPVYDKADSPQVKVQKMLEYEADRAKPISLSNYKKAISTGDPVLKSLFFTIGGFKATTSEIVKKKKEAVINMYDMADSKNNKLQEIKKLAEKDPDKAKEEANDFNKDALDKLNNMLKDFDEKLGEGKLKNFPSSKFFISTIDLSKKEIGADGYDITDKIKMNKKKQFEYPENVDIKTEKESSNPSTPTHPKLKTHQLKHATLKK